MFSMMKIYIYPMRRSLISFNLLYYTDNSTLWFSPVLRDKFNFLCVTLCQFLSNGHTEWYGGFPGVIQWKN